MKQIKVPDDVSSGKSYIVIEFTKVTEASGWGSENDSRVLAPTIYITEDVDDWANHIKALEAKKEKNNYGERVPYVALQIAGKAAIETQVKINV